MNKILGYGTSNTIEVLNSFITHAQQQYEALEQAIVPVDERITDLQKDWELRSFLFWQSILKTSLPAIRDATTQCLNLFDRKQSQTIPVPIAICATSIGYTCDLHCIGKKIEDAGILLTAYFHTSDSNSIEQQIRGRQRILTTLRQLSKVVHEAVDNGRAKLDEAPEEQRKILCPRKMHLEQEDTGDENTSHLRIIETPAPDR